MNNVTIIGAGQLGSRHLQALKSVKFPLNISVIDPSQKSLATAEQRYDEMPKGKHNYKVKYLQEISSGQNIDLVIVATTSDVRARVIKNFLKNNQARYFILEKILFDKHSDYRAIEDLFSGSKIKGWVNLPRRVSPTYKNIKEELNGRAISLRGTGSQWGLACNAVHILDLISYLTGDSDYTIGVHGLDKEISLSKRKGFLEVNGTLCANFKNGSYCELSSHVSGKAPFLMEIFNENARYIIRESEGKYWTSGAKNGWRWEEISFKNPLVSETTTVAVEDILANGSCSLTPYKESAKIHISLLEPLRNFLNKNSGKKYEYYPFT
jgi:predicted dehydrogenase